MQRSQVWLILTAVLFVAWLGYLGYWVLALRREAAEGGGQPIILSRPQFLVASLVVSAEVAGKDQQPLTAKVLEVYWPSNEETRKLVGQSIKVDNLGESEGLSGAGTYLLPLLSAGDGYRVTPTPPSPGYPPSVGRPGEPGPPRVYPRVPSTVRQLEQIQKELHVP